MYVFLLIIEGFPIRECRIFFAILSPEQDSDYKARFFIVQAAIYLQLILIMNTLQTTVKYTPNYNNGKGGSFLYSLTPSVNTNQAIS